MHIDSPAPTRHGISLTPLIDVVFILLIFFMLASSFSDWQGMQVNLGSGESIASDTPELLVLEIRADGAWQLDGKTIDPRSYFPRWQQRSQASGAFQIVLKPGKGTQVQALVSVLGALHQHGLKRVSLASSGDDE